MCCSTAVVEFDDGVLPSHHFRQHCQGTVINFDEEKNAVKFTYHNLTRCNPLICVSKLHFFNLDNKLSRVAKDFVDEWVGACAMYEAFVGVVSDRG